MTGTNKIKKLIPSLLIILILLPTVLLSFSKKTYAWIGIMDSNVETVPTIAGEAAQTVTGLETAVATGETAVTETASLGIQVKNVAIEVGKQLLKAVAKRVLAEMTKSTINWINSDFHGSPLFLENPDSFFQDIAKSELKNIVNTFGYDSLTYPFGKQFALNAIDSYKRQLADNAGYTLSKSMNYSEAKFFREDFNYGGWNGFLINTQYPQNNVVGFNIIATQELQRRIQGTSQSVAQKIQTTLQQGMGFLSPQKCVNDANKANADAYNNGANEFQKPSFQPPENTCDQFNYSGDSAENKEIAACNAAWEVYKAEAKADWEQENTCKGRLVTTTPGSVAGNQVMKAMGASFDQTMLDGAMGNSLSAIFDALINHFLDKGLSGLSSKINPEPETDDWSYNGQTLNGDSSESTGVGSSWDATPDQIIILGDFKKMVDNGIKSTETELKLLFNDTPNDLGIYQIYSKIWLKAQELDKCIPGPDILKLNEKIDGEASKINAEIQDKAGSDSFGGSGPDADPILKEFDLAIKTFKSWINDQITNELPSSLIYIDSVKNVTTLSRGVRELTDSRTARNRALTRLRAIKTNLDTITTQPNPGSPEDKVLVSLWKQYQGASVDFSNTNTIENTRAKLFEVKDMYNELVKFMDPNNPLGCPAERAAKGWSNPGGSGSTFNGGKTEMSLFCSGPVNGGYSHGQFVNTRGVTYPEIPLISAVNVLTYKTVTLMSAFQAANGGNFDANNVFSMKDPRIEKTYSIYFDCNNIFNADLTDYKGDLPGSTSRTNTESNPIPTQTPTPTPNPSISISTDPSTDADPNSNTDLTPDPSTNAN